MFSSSLLGISLLLFALQLASGTITLTQQVSTASSCVIPSSTCWIVEGLASFEHGGCCPTEFYFICNSNNSNALLAWSRSGGSLTKSQIRNGNGGTELRFTNPAEVDAGIYTCTDTVNGDSKTLNITDAPVAAEAITPSITVVAGSPVSVGFYASGIPPPQFGNITWYLNNNEITSGNFDSWGRTLHISSATAFDDGIYRFVVTYHKGTAAQTSAAATVNLTVLTPPTVIVDPQNETGVEEWTSFSLSCTVRADASFIIYWRKLNDTLPVNISTMNTTTSTNTVKSTLTVHNVRVSDAGLYQCLSSFSNGSHLTVSNPATVEITSSIRLVHNDSNFLVSSPLVYVPASSVFYIECQGTGSFDWSKGEGGGASVTAENSQSPYQYTSSNSFHRLVFDGFESADKGYYTCTSDAGVTSTIFITNDNPAVYSTLTTFRVNNHTNLSLSFHTSGSPSPSPSDITWYHNNAFISNADQYYELREGGTVLDITGPSESLTGNYTVIVNTTAGASSLLFNVTYFDPPFITVLSDTVDVLLGTPAVLQCNASSPLDVTLSWVFKGSEMLPEGSEVSDDGRTLTVDTESVTNAGDYSCVASDGISTVSRDVTLNILYGPQSVSFTCTKYVLVEGTTDVSCSCRSNAVPPPTFSWFVNGSNVLPTGIKFTQTSDSVLYWTRGVAYTDEGSYTCRASNYLGSINQTQSIKVNATPIIRSIYPSNSGVSLGLSGATPTFGCPGNSTCQIECVARGWPTPSVNWINSSTSDRLTNSYVIREGGVVSAVLEWNENQSGEYRCESVNEYGSASQTMRLRSVATPTIGPTVPSFEPTSTSVDLRFRLLTLDCITALGARRRAELSGALNDVVLSGCQLCSPGNETVTVVMSDCENGVTVFVASLQGRTQESLTHLYSSLASWWSSRPLLHLSGSLYSIDTNCSLLIKNEDWFNCNENTPLTTPTPTPTLITVGPTSSFFDSYQVIWIVLVSAIAALCVIVGVALFIVLCLCCRTLRRQRKDIEGSTDVFSNSLRTYNSRNTMSRSNMEMDSSSFNGGSRLHMGGERGREEDDDMLSNPEYMQRGLVEHIRRQSLLSDNGSHRRLLQTTPTSDVDYPGFPYRSDSYHDDRRASSQSEVTVSNTQIQNINDSTFTEVLYTEATPPTFSASQPTPTPETNVYDQIRLNATRVGHTSPRRIQQQQPHQSSTLPRCPPTSPKYETPSPPQARGRMMSSPSVAVPSPVPYSLPVSSQGELNKVGVVGPAPRPSQRMQRATSVPSDHHRLHQAMRPGQHRSSVATAKLPAVKEKVTSPPQADWFEGDYADIVTPTPVSDYASSSVSGRSLDRPTRRENSRGVVVPPTSQGEMRYEV